MEPRAARSPRQLPLLFGLVVLLALVAGAIALLNRDDGAGSGATTDPTTVPGEPPSEDAIDDVVAELSAFVAETRQLDFRRPVDVTLLADDEFEARVREDALADDPEDLRVAQRTFNALGLLPRGVDLEAALVGYLEDSVVGFYDPETDELVVRGGAVTPYVRSTLVHELTHALDDQRFELDRPALDDADDESGLGFNTLVEGNAVRVEDAYDAQLTDDERTQRTEEEQQIAARADFGGVPPVVQQLIGFPYLYGPELVGRLVAEGGERRVDEAFTRPPLTSEQARDPASWLAGEAEPIAVEPPPADGDVIDQGVIGEWGLVVLLVEELGQAADEAARGWGGDWYVAWDDGDRTCVRATFVTDTVEDLTELETALDVWANNQLDATVARDPADGGRVTFTSCG